MKFISTKQQKICLIITLSAAALPVAFYLAALAFLPDMIPVGANSAGLLVEYRSRFSFEAFAYSFQSVITVAVMYPLTKLADIFARRTTGSEKSRAQTHNWMLWITCGVTIAMSAVWVYDIIKILAQQ